MYLIPCLASLRRWIRFFPSYPKTVVSCWAQLIVVDVSLHHQCIALVCLQIILLLSYSDVPQSCSLELRSCNWGEKLLMLSFMNLWMSVTAVARGVMFSGCLSHSHERDIFGKPQGNFFKFNINVQLDSRINRWQFTVNCHRYRALKPHILLKTRYLKCLDGIYSGFTLLLEYNLSLVSALSQTSYKILLKVLCTVASSSCVRSSCQWEIIVSLSLHENRINAQRLLFHMENVISLISDC